MDCFPFIRLTPLWSLQVLKSIFSRLLTQLCFYSSGRKEGKRRGCTCARLWSKARDFMHTLEVIPGARRRRTLMKCL